MHELSVLKGESLLQSYTKAISLSLILLVVVIVTATAALRSREQNSQQRENQPAGNQFPIADITVAEGANKIRQARSSKYDLQGSGLTKEQAKKFRIKETDQPVVFDLIPSHAPSLQAIPVSQSDAVVVGEVMRAEAHLSNDQTSVYSEFQVRLGEVIWNGSSETLSTSTMISVDRRGGRVRFPSGKVILRGVYGKNMPQICKRYLFFLKSDSESQSFSIITAYELRNGRVFPLDGPPETENESGQFAVYKVYRDADEIAFRNEVISALQGGRK